MAGELITCLDCNKKFEFSEGEAEFFKEKGFAKPRRCKPCRELRKQQNPQQQTRRV